MISTDDKTAACMITPPGRGGIAVVRLTGQGARLAFEKVFTNAAGIQSGQLRFGKIVEGDTCIDEAVACCISDNEFEINIHGGSAVARHTLAALEKAGVKVVPAISQSSFNPVCEPFDNSMIGQEMLAAIEGVASPLVLHAITSQWSGGLSKLIVDAIDDIGRVGLADELFSAAERFEIMGRLIRPAEVVLAGAPNAGKSTLTNRLIGRDVAIVHSMAGTTRDWIRERTLLDGLPIWLTDTAGLWEADGLHDVDVEAVDRAWQQIRAADLVIMLIAGDENQHCDLPENIDADKLMVVRTKADVFDYPAGELAISTATGQGIDKLKSAILTKLGLNQIIPDQPAAFTQRQADLLNNAAEFLSNGETQESREFLRAML